LAPHFLVVSNMEAADGGAAVLAGNQRVLRARQSDAAFFWENDRKIPLAERVPRLDGRLFYARLGSMGAKVERIKTLARHLTFSVEGAKVAEAERAAVLAKADLTTEMVGEFPELQGVMGYYYAIWDGEAEDVAQAIADHYFPQGPSDPVPTHPLGVAVALADRIDTLVGFFAIDERPTGNKDPFGLRRAALGVIRLVVENRLRLPLAAFFKLAHAQFATGLDLDADATCAALLAFFADRLKGHLKEQGVRHDLVNAVFALGDEDDLVRLLARVAALSDFLATDDGANLLVAYRRAANIVRIEERKDGVSHAGGVAEELLRVAEERDLFQALAAFKAEVARALKAERFAEAMAALARLRRPVDAFFAAVTVNADDSSLRANRLRLLSEIGATTGAIADFSRIEG
jgi:glycyl-tRNA synthetase beta chain